MGLEFRRREYGAKNQSHSSLPRVPAHTHPLSDSPLPPVSFKQATNLLYLCSLARSFTLNFQVDDQFKDDDDFSDPLRNNDQITHDQITSPPHPSFSNSHSQFNRLLMQRFPFSKNSMVLLLLLLSFIINQFLFLFNVTHTKLCYALPEMDSVFFQFFWLHPHSYSFLLLTKIGRIRGKDGKLISNFLLPRNRFQEYLSRGAKVAYQLL